MFELDGRHLKSFVGKDLIDFLLSGVESGMIRADLEAEAQCIDVDNRLALVEGRVDLIRQDLAKTDARVDINVARASEDGDAIINEK